ncbi:hypothetical protein O3M35_009223 [Rhynocoris fuscipes]|uniref:Uncharacterized protein n=1 Tax=Rhynocoris fuscipes TaxID=488301 RepID=A0AAW1D2Y7_9HEMI
MTELERKMCFMHKVKWNPCLSDYAKKLIKAKLCKIRREYKKYLSCCLNMVDTKFAKLELFCWQHC